jgi:hypothetical protein
MAQMGYQADPNDLPQGGGDFPLLPVGDTPMQAISVDFRDTKKGGKMVVWEMVVTSGPNEGRKHWQNVNIANPPGYIPTGADPAEIGQRANNQFAAAVGLTNNGEPDKDARETDNYLFKPFIAVMKVQEGKNGYGPSNNIGSFKPISGGSAPRGPAPAQASSGAPASPAPSNGGGKPKAYKSPDDGKWYDENGEPVQFFKLNQYEKVEG